MSMKARRQASRAENRTGPDEPAKDQDESSATIAGASEAPDLRQGLNQLPGIGPARAAALARLGLVQLRDLLLLVPARVERWEGALPVSAARERVAEDALVCVRVRSWKLARFGRRSLLRVLAADDSGEIELHFFNQAWLRERCLPGAELAVLGRAKPIRKDATLPPVLVVRRLFGEHAAAPRAGELALSYPSCEGISESFLARLCRDAATRFAHLLVDPVPAADLERANVPSLAWAAGQLHQPASLDAFAKARARAAMEPLLHLEARLFVRRSARALSCAPVIDVPDPQELQGAFGFAFTRAQLGVLHDMQRDLSSARPMRRLIQGDVGSGKTAVGLWACLAVAKARRQCAFLAPTELLAEQHYLGARALLERSGVRAALLTGSTRAAERSVLEQRLRSGELQVVFGTHALLSERTRFARLGLAVIDEQHRFGVMQRARLLEKGLDAHALWMTATPIPRTLALCMYGDLDVSVIRELPPGRGTLSTEWLRGARARHPWKLVQERLARNERVYWVVPRIDAGPCGQAGAVARHAALLRTPSVAAFGVELVHGRQNARERSARLERFRRGEVQLLVATTVIEVGVDVPEATAIVIEDAGRLGLAQLHQLRGRVGRGALPSVCYLLGDARAGERLALLVRERDGFAVAEEDLARRGMGDLLGLRQAGASWNALAYAAGDPGICASVRHWIATQPGLVAFYATAQPPRAWVQPRPMAHSPRPAAISGVPGSDLGG